MTRKLKILLLEDLPGDIKLVCRLLEKANLDFEKIVVDTKDNFIRALDEFVPDIILSDHSLPSFNSHEALHILHEYGLKIPFILVSATISEEFAVDVIKRGADDYILKDRPERLPTAIHNSLEKFRLEKERQLYFDELQKKEKLYRTLIENSTDGIIILSAEGKPVYVSSAVEKVLGYSAEELQQKDLLSIAHPDDIAGLATVMEQVLANPGIPVKGHTGRMLHKDGNWRWLEATVTNMLDNPDINGIVDNFRDVTERKLGEEKVSQLSRLYAFISQINQAIVHCLNEEDIFKEACRIAIEIGQLKAAWIGIINVNEQTINLVESSGISPDDVSKFINLTYKNNGLLSHVLQTGVYQVCNNIPDELIVEEWKPFAAHRGYKSCIILPLKKSGRITGTFNLYAADLNFFTEREIDLLLEATDDISFALDNFEKERSKLQSDDRLRLSARSLNQAQSIAHLGSWQLDLLTGIAIWSDEMLRIYGLSPDECKQTRESWSSFIHPGDLAFVLDITREAAITKTNTGFFHRIIRKDGTVRHLRSQAHVELDANGNSIGLHGVAHDVTDMKEAEELLRVSESNLQAIFENTSEGFILTDINGIVKAFNNKSKNTIWLNVEKELRINDSIFDFIHDSRKEIYKDAISKVLSGQTLQYDYPYERKNGEKKWFAFTVNPVYNAQSIVGLAITSADITERKQAEESLKISQSNLRDIIENTDATIYSLDTTLRYIAFNPRHYAALKDLFGLDIEPGDNVYDFLEKMDPAEAGNWQNIYARALEGETVKFEKEYNFNNVFSCISFSIHPIWENQQVIGLSCFTIDVTKRKETENALRQSEFRYRQIVETAQEGIWLIDENNCTTFVNKKMCEILEYSEEEMIGKENSYFMDDTGKTAAKETMRRRKMGIAEKIELAYITKSGKYIWTSMSANPMLDDNGKYKGALGMVSDITEKRNLQNLLEKTNDLARIGSWEIDMSDNTLFWSSTTKQIHGVAADFIPDIETAIAFYKAGTSRNEISNAVQEAMERGIAFDLELQVVTPDGADRWVRVNGEAEFMNDKCSRLYGSFQDIDKRKKAEMEVLKAYEEKNIILESFGDAFMAVDKNWIVTYWNNEAEKLLGIPKNEIVGHHLWDVFSESLDSVSYKKYHQAVEINEVVHFEDFYPQLAKWYEISAYPSPTGLSVYFKDETQRKLTEQRVKSERNLLRTLIDNLPDAIYFKDKSARKLISNKFDYTLLGADAEEDVLGKTDLEILPPVSALIGYNHDLEILRTGRPLINFEESFPMANGAQRWLLTSKMALRNDKNEITGLLGIGRDITGSKVADEKLKELNKELEKNVRQLVTSNEELEQFAYVASHDLQEPLRMITSFLTQLEKKYGDVIEEKGKQYIHFAVDGAKRMRQIILDLLEFSRVGSTGDNVEEIEVAELLNETISLYRKRIEETNARIELKNLPLIKGYRAPLRQIFQNLLSNSLKYQHPGAVPVVVITGEDRDDHWQFSVKDNGIGIDTEYFEKIFIIFQRLHNKDDYSGTGMGLAICKKIVENLGGKIWLESGEGKGSTFFFTIPKKS